MDKALEKILVESLFKEAENIPVVGSFFKHIPVLKVIKAISDDIKRIDDLNEALCVIITETYNFTIIWGLFELKIQIRHYDKDQLKDGFIPFKNELIKQLKAKQQEDELFQLAAFNIHNLTSLPITKHAEAYYFDLFKTKNWLDDEHQIRRLKQFIQRNLTIAFHQLLKSGGVRFEKFTEYTEGRAYEQHVKNYKRKLYLTALGKMYTQDELFGDEGLVLADTYIAPHFYIRERCFAKECSEKIEGKGRLLFEHNAHEFMYAFLRNQDVSSFRPTFKGKVLEECQFDADVINSNFLLLLGMPGQGKSSFCKRFLYDVLEENTVFEQELFFVRLLDMDVKGLMNDLWPNLTKEINKQAKEIVKLQLGITERFNFSEEDIREGILLLDGLDELEMSTNIRNEHAIELCKKIYNETKGELKAVITSRYSRVTEPDLYNYDFIWMEVAELSVNKQKEWFSKYKKHVPQAKLDVVQLWNYDDDYSDLKELLTQPLLLYIIAQLFNEEYIKVIHNSADLYDKLFTSVIDRGYDKKEKGFDNVFIELEKNLKLKEGGIKIMLRKILQEVAFLILINDKEYIGEQQLANATDMDNLNKLISKKDKNELKKIFRLIMMSFYMRNTLKNKDDQHKGDIVQTYGIEFIHKSFREYLTAEYIWRKLQLFREGEKRQERKIYNINKTDEALELIAHLFQYVKFEKDLINHVDNLVLRDTFEVREELLSRFNYFFSELIKRDFLFKLVQGRNPLNLIKTTFYNFWHIYMIIGKDRDNDNAYSNLINFPDNTPSKSHFYSLIRLSEHTLLYNQNLKGSDLANVNLGHFTFNGGDLGDANLIRADLSRSSLRKVNLHKSILKYANLSDSDLWNSNLKEADLSEANLRWVNLINSNLLGAILTNADLTDAELSFVNLRKANLTNTNLTRTNLSNAKLTQSQYDYLKASGQLDQALNVDKIIIVEEGEE